MTQQPATDSVSQPLQQTYRNVNDPHVRNSKDVAGGWTKLNENAKLVLRVDNIDSQSKITIFPLIKQA